MKAVAIQIGKSKKERIEVDFNSVDAKDGIFLESTDIGKWNYLIITHVGDNLYINKSASRESAERMNFDHIYCQDFYPKYKGYKEAITKGAEVKRQRNGQTFARLPKVYTKMIIKIER